MEKPCWFLQSIDTFGTIFYFYFGMKNLFIIQNQLYASFN